MKVWKRSLPVWLLTLVMLLTACGTPYQPDQPDGTETWREAYEETGAYLQAQTAPTVGSIGGEWAVIGLSRARLLSDETAQSYEQTVEDYVKQAGSVRLHHAKSTENSRTILGLTAAGYNAANVAGVDLTAGLTDMAYLRAQGTNGPIWALIALDCHGYDIPQCADGEEQVTREGLVAEILSYQCSDGGWALMGDESDVDMTAMALTALAPYKAAILPLSKKLSEPAMEIYNDLCKDFMLDFDETGSIGKRYRREDEIGTPFCITVDFDTVGDGENPGDHCVTVRERDTMEQVRIPISELKAYLTEKLAY